MLEKPRKIKQNWASVSWSTVWRLHVVHPSSPSADLFQMYLYGSASAEPFFVACFPGELGSTTAHLRRLPRKGRAGGAEDLCSSIACRAQPCQRCTSVLQALIYSLIMLKKLGNTPFPGFFYTQNSAWTVRFWWNLNGNLWVYSGQITGGQAHFDLLWVKLLVDNRSKWSPILPSTDEHILDWFT